MKSLGDGENATWALAARLNRESKIVILVDDIWSRVELGAIGIPAGNQHKS